MAYNAKFSYSGNSIGVYLTKFWYSWSLQTKSSSVSRLAQTVYPFRAVQGELNVELQFNGPDEYRRFCDFARGYHQAVASGMGAVGSGVPKLMFSSSVVPAMSKELSGRGDDGGILYSVALPSIPVRFSYDMVAPTLTLSLPILSGGDMTGGVPPSYSDGGALAGFLTELPKPANVKSKGDSAYVKQSNVATRKDMRSLYSTRDSWMWK